ncbi:MAG: SpoIIE family protein phosphatase [Phycisphaeraceae bacterium]|nr:SpoIIE family protein phosphatase [Phycisphaeraceae bacterium]
MLELVRNLSLAGGPQEVLGVFSRGMRELYGSSGYISLSVRGLEPGSYKITRLLLNADWSNMTASDPWGHWGDLPVRRGGLLGQIIADGQPKVIHNLDPRNDPVLGDALAGFGSLMAVPLFDQGRALNWAVTVRREPNAFTVHDLEEAILRGNLVGGTVRMTLLARQLAQANAAIEREVQRIADIQRALIPAKLPQLPGLTMASSYHTFDQAGGDLFDVVPLAPAGGALLWGLFIADVAGHGPASAVVMAMMHAILYATPPGVGGPGDYLRFANDHLLAKRIENTFVTAFLSGYDPVNRRLTYSRAGHPAPMLRHRDGQVTRLDQAATFPLGIFEHDNFQQATHALEPGQTVLMFTDGVVDARSPDGRDFGEEALATLLTRIDSSPRDVVHEVEQALIRHQAGRPAGDDRTLLVLRVE